MDTSDLKGSLVLQHEEAAEPDYGFLQLDHFPSRMLSSAEPYFERVRMTWRDQYALPYLTSPTFTVSSFTLSSFTSPHLTLPHLTSPHLTSPHFTSPYLTRYETLYTNAYVAILLSCAFSLLFGLMSIIAIVRVLARAQVPRRPAPITSRHRHSPPPSYV